VSDESLIQQCRELFHHADLPHHTYEDYCKIVCQAGKIYLQLLGDYLAYVPDDEVAKRVETIGKLMVEIQKLL
jgi:hypothetical protein